MIPGISIDLIAHLIERRSDQLILPRFGKLRAEDIDTKSHANDFVTIADTETEIALRADLTEYVPGCIVIGEEAVSNGSMDLSALHDKTKIVFVADPVDGTYNFKNGHREFACMLALVVDGETKAGWIFDVLGENHYIAVKGQGAYKLPKGYTGSYQNGERLHVSPPRDFNDPAMKGFLAPFYFPKEMRPFLKKEVEGRFNTLRCSAHEYIHTATGQADFVTSFHMKPWDHLAGSLLVQEAGGVVQQFDGSSYEPTDEKGGLIAASHPGLVQELQDRFIQPGLKIIAQMGPPKP